MENQVIITETQRLKSVTASAVVNGLNYSIFYKMEGNVINEVQIGVTKTPVPTEEGVSEPSFNGSVNFKDGFCVQTINLKFTAAERLQITADTNTIYDQISNSIV